MNTEIRGYTDTMNVLRLATLGGISHVGRPADAGRSIPRMLSMKVAMGVIRRYTLSPGLSERGIVSNRWRNWPYHPPNMPPSSS